MPSVETIRPLRVAAPGTSELKISARGPNTIFYGDNAQVSSSNKIGNLASGESLTIKTKPVWLLAEATPAVIDFEEKDFLFGESGRALPYVVVNGSSNEAITAAVEFLSGSPGTIIFPARTYVFTGVVKVPSNVQFDGMHRAVLLRGAGYTGAFFEAAVAIENFSLNGFIWDNGATSNLMWKFPVGSAGFDHIWARYQNLTSSPGEVRGNQGVEAATLSKDLIFRDIRYYAVGSPENQVGINVFDASDVIVDGVKTFVSEGATALGAFKIESTSKCTGVLRNITVRNVEAEKTGASAVLIRNNGAGKMEGVTVASVKGEELGTAAIAKGLVVVGEQVGGEAGTSSLRGIHVSDIDGRDFWGNLVTLGGGVHNGVINDFYIAGVAAQGLPASGTPDTTRANVGVSITGAQHGTLDGMVVRNTGRGGLRFATGDSQPCAFITGTGIDIEKCVQNPNLVSPATWEEGGVFIDKDSHDLDLQGHSIDNYSAATSENRGAGITSLSSETTNRIRLRFRSIDTRAEKFQAYGVRIGKSGSDASQPNEWTIEGCDFESNLVGSILKYGSTDHKHRIVNNKALGGRSLSGTGSPENIVTGSVGDEYRRTDGASGTTFYVKESGESTNTGWAVHPPLAAQATLEAALAAISNENGQPGVLAPGPTALMLSNGVTGGAIVANRAYLMRFVAPAGKLIKIAFLVTEAKEGNCDVGIYDATGLKRVVSAGETAGQLTTTGVKTVTIASTELTAGGVYYAAFACATTPKLLATAFSGPAIAQMDLFGNAPPHRECFVKAASFPLPEMLTEEAPVGVNPVLAIRTA